MAVTRRELLRNTATLGSTAAIFTPFLQSVALHASEAADMPKRFVFIIKASGIDNYNLMPETVADRKDTVLYHEDSYKHLKPFLDVEGTQPRSHYVPNLAISPDSSSRLHPTKRFLLAQSCATTSG